MELPIIIVEFGQQRQRLTLKKFFWNIDELVELFSQTFQLTFDLQNYDIFLLKQRLHSTTKLDLTHLNNYQRFQIRFNHNRRTKLDDSPTFHNEDEIILLKQRLKTASIQIMDVAALINSIRTNYENLIKLLIDHGIPSSERSNLSGHGNQTVPPGFKPLSNPIRSNISPQDSQSTDEGIDRDTSSLSIFESARSDYDLGSIYLECREDATIINRSNDTSQLEWRNQPYRPRSHWNSCKTSNQNSFAGKPRLKKLINPNKAPLPQEKKKNIPCKYAAGGNCKRGSQCRFIHVV